jgi:hypothetical protein
MSHSSGMGVRFVSSANGDASEAMNSSHGFAVSPTAPTIGTKGDRGGAQRGGRVRPRRRATRGGALARENRGRIVDLSARRAILNFCED